MKHLPRGLHLLLTGLFAKFKREENMCHNKTKKKKLIIIGQQFLFLPNNYDEEKKNYNSQWQFFLFT